MDSYVVEANIHHPTDTSLLGDGIRVITRTVLRIKRVGLAVGVTFVNHTKKNEGKASPYTTHYRMHPKLSFDPH